MTEMEAGRWHSQQPELLVICQRYRGKPSDVGVCMFGRVVDQHGMETQERRMSMRKSMDGFGAAFGGRVSHVGQTPMFFNMFLRKTGAGDESSVRAPVPRVILMPSLSGRAAQEMMPRVSVGSRASPCGHRSHDDDVQKEDLPVCTIPDDLFSDDEVNAKGHSMYTARAADVTGLAKRVFSQLCNMVLCGRQRARPCLPKYLTFDWMCSRGRGLQIQSTALIIGCGKMT